MMLKMKSFLTGIIVCAVAALVSAYVLWPLQVLTLRDVGNRQALFAARVSPGDEFRLKFLHSYERGWVIETYKVGSEDFYLTEHAFQVFNYDSREGTYPGDFVMEDGYAKVKNIDHYKRVEFPHIYVRVANIVPQMVEVGGKTVSLPNLRPGGTLLELQVEKLNRYEIWSLKIAKDK